ncbi:MAG: hypothetical protein ACREPM_20450 [Gemmatimonadaceae bacterium]
MRRDLPAAALLGTLVLASPRLGAQRPSLTAYYQNVGIGIGAADAAPAGALDDQRLRVMWTPRVATVAIDVAYEQTIIWRDSPATTAEGGLLPGARSGGDWLDVGGPVYDGAHVSWRQRFDRLSASYTSGPVTATVGRQAVSWATTLFLTPADPFVPFDPSDPFREYRTGIDAARVQWFAGPFSTLDLVVRPADSPIGRTITALLRGKTTLNGWDLSMWGGAIHDAPGGALGLTTTLGGSAIRAEAAFRRDTIGHAIARTALGVDHRFSVLDRDLYTVVEYQHDAFGAEHASDLAAVAQSAAAWRNELQVFGRDEAAVQATYQVHPLVSAEVLTLLNLRDGSMLFSPTAAVSLGNDATVRAGVFVASGKGGDRTAPRSEYGRVPRSAYVALSMFF